MLEGEFMETAATALINALVLSAIYILVALGFALLLSIIGIFNFAHGALYMAGAYVTYILGVTLGINQWLALLLSLIIMSGFGLFLERYCFRPFQNMNSAMLMAIAIIYFLETTVSVTIGGYNKVIPQYIPEVLKLGVFSVAADRLVTVVVGGVLLVAVTLFIRNTIWGQQMLAIAQNREGAILQGIKVNRVAAIATLAACAMAGLSGSFMGSLVGLTPYMGDGILLKAIQVIILSGIGSIGGILAGGLIIGTIDAVLPLFTNAPIAASISLGVVIIILLLQSRGLFGYDIF